MGKNLDIKAFTILANFCIINLISEFGGFYVDSWKLV